MVIPKLDLCVQLDLVKVLDEITPPLEMVSSVLKWLEPEPEDVVLQDHLVGQLGVVSRLVCPVSFTGSSPYRERGRK